MGDINREPGETHTLLKPMQERVDEMSKTQSEMMRMQREMMGVMLSLSLRLDSALGKSKDEESTPQKSRSVIDLTADEAQASNSNKGKGKTIEQDGQTAKGESNADVLKAVAALSARLDKVGSNVDSLLKSVRVLERNATGAAAAKPPVVERVPGPSRPAAVVVRPAAQPAPPVQPRTPVDNVAPIAAPAGSQDKNSEPGPAPFGTLRRSSRRLAKHATTLASHVIAVDTPEGSRKRRRVTFDSEDEVEFLAVGCPPSSSDSRNVRPKLAESSMVSNKSHTSENRPEKNVGFKKAERSVASNISRASESRPEKRVVMEQQQHPIPVSHKALVDDRTPRPPPLNRAIIASKPMLVPAPRESREKRESQSGRHVHHVAEAGPSAPKPPRNQIGIPRADRSERLYPIADLYGFAPPREKPQYLPLLAENVRLLEEQGHAKHHKHSHHCHHHEKGRKH